MLRYPRKTALLALAISLAIALATLAATGQFRTTRISSNSLADLEAQVQAQHKANKVDINTLTAYAQALTNVGQFGKAAENWSEIIDIDSSRKDARFNAAL